MEALEEADRPLLVPILVVAEVSYLIETRLGAEAEVWFLGSLAAGELLVERVHERDWLRIAELVWRYRDLALGTVDASLIAAAERLQLMTVVTLDRRHLGVVQPRHTRVLELVP